MQAEIARFLAEKAVRQTRATYQQVGDAVGWNHPTGRGLGKNLEVVLHALHDRGLPPLTTILVKRGERHPEPDAMAYIRGALGDIDIDAAQREVFAFDWRSIPDLAPDVDRLPSGRDIWLTSFWGFDPASWGCIGFADEAKRNRYLRLSTPNALVAIYVTKGKGPEEMRGKVVGLLEVSHNAGHASQFIAGDRWAEKEMDPASRGKWLFAVQATRAWRIVQEDWKPVEQLFPAAYASAHAEYIGSSGVQVDPVEAEHLMQLDVYEVPVYGQGSRVNGTIQTLESALSPSRAIPPATEPYWVGETDGPKHLYILELSGDTSAYLGRSPADVDGRAIIKVGFSRSPAARRDQIQSAYPQGQFKWVIKYLIPSQMPHRILTPRRRS
ncbi:hypothetical protein NKI91_14810 [Mesorhizobium sp. M0312]|uniref:hypothetical protein n=1 Tax=Mesorhizobium sp. M0312 TaxID=2956934 RepID=UPI00333D7B27